MPAPSDLAPAVEAALIELVRATARDLIVPRFRALDPGQIAAKTGPDDLVTIADREAEARMTAALPDLLPDALVVGEEAVEDDPALLDRLWQAETAVILDPVDGTANFAAGIATVGVILAVVQRGQVVFGLLYDPLLDDWVMARRGGGAWFARPGRAPVRLHARAARPVDQMHGYLSLNLFAPGQRAQVAAQIPRFGRISSLRCACHEYRQMALGWADFMVTPVVKPWDHAAGSLVITEIGGCSDTPRGSYDLRGPTPWLMQRAHRDSDPAPLALLNAAF